MTASSSKNFRVALQLLERNGLLLVSGTEIPDVCSVVSPTRSKGSWWASPFAHEIFAVNEKLSDHPDVTATKLVAGKVTFIHRNLWNNLLAVSTARESWQLQKLPPQADRLLQKVDREGTVYTNALGDSFGPKPGDVVRQLELRLLLHTDQFHTESGKHAKILESWSAWANRVGLKAQESSPTDARRFFEQRLSEITRQSPSSALLPWPSTR